MASEVLIKILRTIPRFTFDLQPVSKIFTLQFDSYYVQSLFVFVVVILFIGAALLLTIIITWICQCCIRQDANVKSRRSVRQLSLVLFIISIICFFCLGACLFGNEHLNRSVMNSIISAEDISRNLLFADSQSILLNDYCLKTIKQIDALSAAVESAAEKTTDLNKTALHEFTTILNSVSQKIDLLGIDLAFFRKVLSGNLFLERSSLYTQRIELERWVLCATLLSIMFIVLFAGVIAFCRQSKKGAVVFSGLGFTIFIVGWLLLAAIFPASMALVDFCADGTQFIREYISNDTMGLFDFYRKCNPTINHDNFPSVIRIDKISKQLSDIQEMSENFDSRIEVLFNGSIQKKQVELFEQVKIINDGMTLALKNIGALETTVGCYTYHNDMLIMERSFCIDGIIGSSILLYCLVLLEAFLFMLLLIVSKSWQLFARLPSDYVEVDEEDPFFPRGNDSTIPVDIYGSHVLNPRTRFASSLDHTEQSTGTTSATCGLANGSINNHTSASTALLNSNVESPTPPWHRGLASQPTASSSVNAPPAVGTSSMIHTAYQANTDEATYQRRNYNEQFDV